jgi:hypothetical protein
MLKEMDKNVTIKSTQNILDLSLQYYGSVENVYDVIDALGLESIDSDPTGKVLTVPSTKNNVYQYCLRNGIELGTNVSPLLVEPLVLVVNYRVTTGLDQRVTTGGDNRII